MTTRRTFSVNEVSGLLGVHRSTVLNWLRNGCPFIAQGDKQRGKEWQLDLPAIVEWRERRAVEAAIGDTQRLDIDEARRRKTAAEAALAELELARQRGEVVEIGVVQAVIGDQLSACRAKLLGIPTKMGRMVAPLTDVRECTALLEAAQREALDELVGWAGGYDAGSDAADGGDPGDDSGEDETAAPADGEPMGGSVPPTERRSKRGTRPMGDSAE